MTCTHYWLIEEAKGPTSKGTCKLCGATSEFTNHPQELDRYNNVVIGKSYLQKEHRDETRGAVSEMQ